MENIALKIESTNGELVIRTGNALPLEVPKRLIISGEIESVEKFLCKRSETIKKETANITIDEPNLKIMLTVDEQSERGMVVIGKLIRNPDLDIFCINQEKILNQKELANLIRKNKYFFKDKDNSALLKSIENFVFNKTLTGKTIDDRRGNAEKVLSSTLNQSVELSFFLEMPIYQNLPNVIFPVQIYVDVTDAGARFWLESVELFELERTIAKKALQDQEDLLKSFGIVIIRV